MDAFSGEDAWPPILEFRLPPAVLSDASARYEREILALAGRCGRGPRDARKLRQALSRATTLSRVALVEDRVVGYLQAATGRRRLVLEWLLVEPASRGRGIGTQLVEALVAETTVERPLVEVIVAETDLASQLWLAARHFVGRRLNAQQLRFTWRLPVWRGTARWSA